MGAPETQTYTLPAMYHGRTLDGRPVLVLVAPLDESNHVITIGPTRPTTAEGPTVRLLANSDSFGFPPDHLPDGLRSILPALQSGCKTP